MTQTLNPKERREALAAVLRWRVLIARAGQADSLAWWRDESLTEGGRFLLSRLYPRSGAQAATRLALEAARVAHEAALPAGMNVRHLFFLGVNAELELRTFALEDFGASEVIVNEDGLRTLLPAANASLEVPASGGLLEVSGEGSIWALSKRLAGAYALGRRDAPVFPFARVAGGV